MSQTRHTVDQIIAKLRRADVELGKGKTVPDACKVLGVSEQTYYRWRQKYGGLQPAMAKELKALQKENARLKKMVAEQALDMEIPKEAAHVVDVQSLKCVTVWGLRKCQSDELAVSSINRAVLSDTRHVDRTMTIVCFVKCDP